MLRDKDGNRLFRKVTVRIVYPDSIFPTKTLIQHAGARQGFGPEGVDQILNGIADQLETLYPWWEFQVVELTPEHRTARYVFTFAGYRAGYVPQDFGAAVAPGINPQSSSTLDLGTAESTTPAEEMTEAGNTLS